MDDLPYDDPSLRELSREARRAIAEHWRRRARSEQEVGHTFAAMVPLLSADGATAVVLELLTRGADDEGKHARICLRLAEAYAEGPVQAPAVGEVTLPRFGVGNEDLERALLVAGLCCINETIATAWLSASAAAAEAPLARAANRAHLRDEIDHARLGWAHLASTAVSPSTREALAGCLPLLLEANVPGWDRDDEVLPSAGIPGHGHLSTAASRQVIHEAVRDLVIPGFAHVGVDTTPALAWLTASPMARSWPPLER